MSTFSHHDTFNDHMNDVAKDFLSHNSVEQQHLLQGVFEGAAGIALKMTGNDALGDMFQAKAKDDLAQGHLSFKDYGDIYHAIDHLV